MKKNDRKISQVRKSSQDLFIEAKRRFHYKPQSKRTEPPKQPNIAQSPECSSVTENNKEQSNDFSWLDKMVSGFEWAAKQSENKKGTLQKPIQPKVSNQTKLRVVLGEKKLNKSNSTNKPIIKRSLEKSLDKSKGKLHKAVVTRKLQIIEPEPDIELPPEPEVCPELFPPTQREATPKNNRQNELSSLMNKLQTEQESHVKVLKIEDVIPEQNANLEIQQKSQTPPVPEEYKQPTRVLGKIKKNLIRHNQTQCNEGKSKPMHHSLSLAGVNRRESRLGALSLCHQPIQQEESEPSESNRLEDKFRQIFKQLDIGQLGFIDRTNCFSDNMHDDLRYLVGPILSKIKYQEKKFTLKNFIEQGKKIISALEAHEVSKLLRCSITNRFFDLDTKRSEYQKGTHRNTSLNQRHSNSAYIHHYRDYRRPQLNNIWRNQSIDNHAGVSASLNEDWNKSTEEPLQKARTRNIIKPDVPAPPTINTVRSQLGQAEPINFTTFEKREQLNQILSPERVQKQQLKQTYRSRNSRSPTQLDISQLDREFHAEKERSREGSQERYNLEKEEYSRIDFLNEKLSKYIQQNQLRITRSNSVMVSLDDFRRQQ